MRKSMPLLALILLPATLAAQTVAEEVPPADIAAKVASATAAADAGGAGAYPAEMISESSLPTHTVYRPRNLAAATRGGKLPIIAWGNGACTNLGNRFRYFLTEVASNGYLVVAVGPIGPHTVEWKIDLNANNPIPVAERLPGSYAAQLTDAIDWAVAENARPGSPYYQKLDTNAIAVMGQSCGGLQAISAAADRRVKTLMVLNSGTFPATTKPLLGTGDAIKASLKRIHVPTAWISGDESDIAYKNANEDFEAFTTAPALRAWHKGTGHAEHYRDVRGGPFTPVVIDWLDWRLKHRPLAAKFSGVNCTLCTQPGWTVKQKGL